MRSLLTWIVVGLHLSVATQHCLDGCECSTQQNAVICNNGFNNTLAGSLFSGPNTTQMLHIRGANFHNLSAIDFIWSNATELYSVAFIKCNITVVGVLASIPSLQTLDLNTNNLTMVSFQDFYQLSNLTSLNVSHNSIQSIASDAFTILEKLRILDVSFNQLFMLSDPDIFQSVPFLQQLNCSDNNISFINPAAFRHLGELSHVNLESNQLQSLASVLFDNTSITELHLGNNPWHCHCGIDWLVYNLQDQASNPVYVNTHRIQCHQPDSVFQTLVQDLDPRQLPCEHPEFVETPLDDSFIVWHTYYLHCNATGYPKPSIYWQGPRGILVHRDQQHFMPGDIHKFSDKQSYDGLPTYRKAVVKALKNGSLEFTNFRNNYVGNYTCYAANPMGIVSTSALVNIESEFYRTMVWGVVFGSAVALVFLIGSCIAGAIRMCTEKCCCKERHKTIYADEPYDDEAEFWDEYFRHPLDSNRGTPEYWPSPVKCITPAEPGKSELSDFNRGIFNTLDAVRTRLTVSMGRHVDQMRSRADTMRQTGKNLRIDMTKKVERVRYKAHIMRDAAGIRMTNLRETSSQTLRNLHSSSGQYAHRMREGMGVKVEAVKYSVKSLKEFCGASNLGQTLSVPSISTNVDSQETEEVYRTITFV